MEKILWQPHLDWKTSFYVTLDETIARELIRAKLPPGIQTRFNELMSERLNKKHLNPCTFYEDTAFIRGFYINGNGVWLSTDHMAYLRLLNDKPANKPIKYDSHNVDHSYQTMELLHLFDNWIEYAETLIEMAEK